jgi:hypothetical protein
VATVAVRRAAQDADQAGAVLKARTDVVIAILLFHIHD